MLKVKLGGRRPLSGGMPTEQAPQPPAPSKPQLPVPSPKPAAVPHKSTTETSRESFNPEKDLANVLKSKFQSGQSVADSSKDSKSPPIAKKPAAVAPKPAVKPKNDDESSQSSDGSLAEVLKSKFEARQKNKDSETPGKPEPPPSSSSSSRSSLPAKPLLPPSKNAKPVVTAKKSDASVSESSSDVDADQSSAGSGLAGLLKSKFESRQGASGSEVPAPSEVPKGNKKTFPTKPLIPGKAQALPTGKTKEEEEKPASPSMTALKSRFEAKESTSASPKPGVSAVKPSVASKPKPLAAAKPVPTAPKPSGINGKQEKTTSSDKVGNLAKTFQDKLEFGSKPPQLSVSSSNGTSNGTTDNDVIVSRNTQKPAGKKVYVALASFDASNEGEISLNEGQELEVLEKTDSWWLVQIGDQDGWAPATYIKEFSPETNGHGEQERNVANKNSSVYRASAAFTSGGEGEVSFAENEEITVVEQHAGGWWFVRTEQEEGWAPANYLQAL